MIRAGSAAHLPAARPEPTARAPPGFCCGTCLSAAASHACRPGAASGQLGFVAGRSNCPGVKRRPGRAIQTAKSKGEGGCDEAISASYAFFPFTLIKQKIPSCRFYTRVIYTTPKMQLIYNLEHVLSLKCPLHKTLLTRLYYS